MFRFKPELSLVCTQREQIDALRKDGEWNRAGSGIRLLQQDSTKKRNSNRIEKGSELRKRNRRHKLF